MKWNELYYNDKIPSLEDIERYIGEGVQLWQELIAYIEETYQVKPQLSYSKCAGQPGWNVKYKKSSKSLCTLYPMEDYFIALIVVGEKEETEVELVSESFTPYIAELYSKTPFSCGGHWLMIEVKDKDVLNDLKKLITIRVTPNVVSQKKLIR